MSSQPDIDDALREAIISRPDVILDDNDLMHAFLRDLGGEVADILRVDAVKLVLESVQNDNDPAIKRLGDVLSVAEPGFIDTYLTQGRGGGVRQVTLRQVQAADPAIYGESGDWIRSDA